MRRASPFLLLVGLIACQRAKDGAKDALNASGEIAGKAASEVLEGVTTGVEETWDVDVRLDSTLAQRGVSLGRTTVTGSNTLSVYLIADRDFNDTLAAFATGKDGVETGRARTPVALKAGMADYIDLVFQERTDLKRKSTIVIR